MMGTDIVVEFNSRSGYPSSMLSNFHMVPITDREGGTWPSVEHMFQAAKCTRRVDMEYIRKVETPGLAKSVGRRVLMRKNWNEIRIEVMRRILYRKFSQNRQCREYLLSTGNITLVESSFRDGFWGNGPDGTGQNHMGRLLMELRSQLREEEYDERLPE